jgi:hypothetical protein
LFHSTFGSRLLKAHADAFIEIAVLARDDQKVEIAIIVNVCKGRGY